jgi:hypothetical protein
MATSLSLENDSSLAQGYLKVNGSTAATITTSGITGNLVGNVTGSLTQGGSLTLATAQTASGTAVDFTSIPSWVKRVTVMFNGVSTNGTSIPEIRLGVSGTPEITGYSAAAGGILTANNTTRLNSSTSGFILAYSNGSTDSYSGSIVFTILNSSTNNWTCAGSLFDQAGLLTTTSGAKSLSGTLNMIRITTQNGTDTFDAGTINISYEG